MLIVKINLVSLIKASFLVLLLLILNNCGIYKKVDTREVSTNADERARKAINEGKGVNLRGIIGGGNKGFEFSSANPMWKASLNAVNFIPLATVDYAGGVIITDWYSANLDNSDYIKINIKFLSNEIRSDSIQISVFKKNCTTEVKCKIYKDDKSQIRSELKKIILSNAAVLEKEDKLKK